MAACLGAAGLGPAQTNHLPGLSWHQWGEAADIFLEIPTIDGAIWEGSHTRKVATIAKDVGLHHSLFHPEWPGRRKWHVQLRPEDNPGMVRGLIGSWEDVEKEMRARFFMDPPGDTCPNSGGNFGVKLKSRQSVDNKILGFPDTGNRTRSSLG